MPGGDKTGPRGDGPRTGRGAGYCSGSDKPGYESRGGRGGGAGRGGGGGRGRGGGGRGWGGGRGFGRGGWNAPADPVADERTDDSDKETP